MSESNQSIPLKDHPLSNQYFPNQTKLINFIREYAKSVYNKGDSKDSPKQIFIKSLIIISLQYLYTHEQVELQILSKAFYEVILPRLSKFNLLSTP